MYVQNFSILTGEIVGSARAGYLFTSVYEWILGSSWGSETFLYKHLVCSYQHNRRPRKRGREVEIVLKRINSNSSHGEQREDISRVLPLTEQAKGPPESPLQASIPPSRYPAQSMPSGKLGELSWLP